MHSLLSYQAMCMMEQLLVLEAQAIQCIGLLQEASLNGVVELIHQLIHLVLVVIPEGNPMGDVGVGCRCGVEW